MSLVVITAPTATLVSLAEAKAHLRVDHADDDTRIQALLWAAQNEFAGPDGWVGRSLALQTLELRLPQFPAACPGVFSMHPHGPNDIVLPCPPLLVDDTHPLTVKYTDVDGAEQTADPALYAVVSGGAKGTARIALNYAQRWPLPRWWQADAVRIRYFAGYGTGDTAAEGLKAAIKLHVELAYDGEDDKTRRAMNDLLSVYRLY